MAEKAMELIGKNIRRFVARRTDLEAAEAMLTGSLFAGIAFSYARLGNVHAMSHPVSAFFDVPHGVANAVLLPVIAEYNALADHGRYLKIYNYISEIPAYADEFEPMMLVGAIRELTAAIGIPASLTDAIRQAAKGKEVTAEEIESKIVPMAVDAMKSGNIAVNPRAVSYTHLGAGVADGKEDSAADADGKGLTKIQIRRKGAFPGNGREKRLKPGRIKEEKKGEAGEGGRKFENIHWNIGGRCATMSEIRRKAGGRTWII